MDVLHAISVMTGRNIKFFFGIILIAACFSIALYCKYAKDSEFTKSLNIFILPQQSSKPNFVRLLRLLCTIVLVLAHIFVTLEALNTIR